ncbi:MULTISPECIES: hypothetical protein [Oceanobacillus]|uniref:hypothetical protein n=1 Tax=Oceanobacillus TaxID=182709 RepID=UPI00059614FA|nr:MULTISPECIES: hypothetical protein [Oceanobacillus]
MGYQESIVEIQNEFIKKQVKNSFIHKANRKDYPMIDLYALIEVKENFETEVFNIGRKKFISGQLYLFIGGERSHQRLLEDVEQELNIGGITNVVPIEDVLEVFESNFKCIEKYVSLSIFECKEITPPEVILKRK